MEQLQMKKLFLILFSLTIPFQSLASDEAQSYQQVDIPSLEQQLEEVEKLKSKIDTIKEKLLTKEKYREIYEKTLSDFAQHKGDFEEYIRDSEAPIYVKALINKFKKFIQDEAKINSTIEDLKSKLQELREKGVEHMEKYDDTEVDTKSSDFI